MNISLAKELQLKTHNNKIITNDKVFNIDYIPKRVQFRDSVFKDLFLCFKSIFEAPNGSHLLQQTIILIGKPGTGKTLVSKIFGKELERLVSVKLPHFNFEYKYINCRRNRTVYSVLITLMRSFVPEFPTKGFSSPEILRMIQNLLGQTKIRVLVILDEINYLKEEPEFQDFLYSLTRLNDEFLSNSSSNLSLLLISQNRTFLDELDDSTSSSLKKNIIQLKTYTKHEIFSILKERIIFGLKDSKYDENLLKLISEIPSLNGNARYAIEILWRIIHDLGNIDQKISKEILNFYINQVFPFSRQKLIDLTSQQKLFLFSVANVFVNYEKCNFITLSQIKTEFQLQIQERGLKFGIGNTSLWNHLKTLKQLDLLETNIVSKNYRGRFTKIFLKCDKKLLQTEIRNLIDI